MSSSLLKTTAQTVVPVKVSGKQTVFHGLVEGLLKGDLKGGDRLTEARAVKLFGVSRTPVREALLELQGIGLVELRRNCGAVFSPFGEKELRDLYAVRSLLEVEATRLAAPNMNRKSLQELITEIKHIRDSGGVDPHWKYDKELHTSIAEASGNHRLSAEIARYGGLIQMMRETVGDQSLDIHTQSAEEHLEILEALLAGKSGLAAKAMHKHLAQASESAVDAINTLRKG